MTTEWVTLHSHDGDPWRVNVTFMLSTYGCMFGAGCPGTVGGSDPHVGCCAYGFVMEPEERKAITERMRALTEDDWHLAGKVGPRSWYATRREEDGSTFLNSVVHDDTGRVIDQDVEDSNPESRCIFYNPVPGKEGCAFHRAAIRTGEPITEWKPEVCWIAPLHVEETGTERVIDVMTNRTWGQDTHEPLKWWCIEQADPYDKARPPVYQTLETELRRIMGDIDYDSLAAYLSGRMAAMATPERRGARRYIPVRPA